MHEAPTTTGSGKGQMGATLLLCTERLFLGFKPMKPRSKWSNLTVALRLTDIKYIKYIGYTKYII